MSIFSKSRFFNQNNTDEIYQTSEVIKFNNPPQTKEDCYQIFLNGVENGLINCNYPLEYLKEGDPGFINSSSPFQAQSVIMDKEPKTFPVFNNGKAKIYENPYIKNVNAEDFKELYIRHSVYSMTNEVLKNYAISPERNPQNEKLKEHLSGCTPIVKDMIFYSGEDFEKTRKFVCENFSEFCPDFDKQCESFPNYSQASNISPLSDYQKYLITYFNESGSVYDITSDSVKKDIEYDKSLFAWIKEHRDRGEKVSEGENKISVNILPEVTVYGDKEKVKNPKLNISQPSSEEYLQKVSASMQNAHNRVKELRERIGAKSQQEPQVNYERSIASSIQQLRNTQSSQSRSIPRVIDANVLAERLNKFKE